MDIQRYLLIGASAALAIMLLGEWTAFKASREPELPRDRLTDQAPAAALRADTAPASADTPTAAETTTPVAEDLPALEAVDERPTATETSAAAEVVTVVTDTLRAAIDLRGGDIIEVALPGFPESIDQPGVPFVLLEDNATRTYVAQSGLVGPDGIDAPERAQYRSNTRLIEQQGDQPVEAVLDYDDGTGITIQKIFRFTPGSYLIDVEYVVLNNSDQRWRAVPFAQIKRDSSAPPQADTSGFGLQPFLGAALTQPDERFTKFSFDDIADEPFRKTLPGGWVAMLQHYFVTAWIPNPDQSHSYSTRRTRSGFNIIGLTSPEVAVDPGNSARFGARFYAGPKDQYSLAEISPHLDLTVDYGFLWWIAQPLFWLLTQIQAVVVNWGVAIILLTVLIKLAFFQLSATSYKSMAKMRKVQPKMQAIREEFADDKQKQSQAMMELYRKEKINPMGGCLPILIQMPVFIALYWVLMESVELRQAPFALWIHDLSVMDPYFVLPILMGASMFFMQKLNPPPPDPMQAKIMQWLPVMFTFFFLWFPAGLVLYWLVNNLLSMAQQWVITRRIERSAG